MKISWIALVPIVITAVLAFLLFVPSVLDTNFTTGTAMFCNGSSCVTFVQYDSISYAYAGWGAYYQTGVNYYTLQGWMCSCPPNAVDCCVPPLASLIWPIIVCLLAADIASIIVITRFGKTH